MALPEYREFKRNRRVLCKETKRILYVLKRDHKQRSVFLSTEPASIVTDRQLGGKSWMTPIGNWRTIKELRKHFVLLNQKTAQILYSNTNIRGA